MGGMPSKAEQKMKAKYRSWSKKRRFETAARKVVLEGWTQTEAAREFGVSRPRLSHHVKEFRAAHEERVRQAKAEQMGDGAVVPVEGDELLGTNSSGARVFLGSFQQFDDRYFSQLICPDCDVHHARPEFHDEMMKAVDSDRRRVLINLPPYHAKSTTITVKYTLYRIARDPNVRVIIVSKSQDFAETFLHSIKEWMTNVELYGEGPNLIEEIGPFQPESSGNWSKTRLYVASRSSAEKDPTIQVLGVGGQMYGRRADVIIADDVATLENQRNPERVQSMIQWFDKEVASRIGKSGQLIWVGTRVYAGDIYATLKDRSTYKVLRYPVLLDEGREGDEVVLWPEHFPYSQVMIHRDEMSPADFQLIYQNVDLPGLGASFPPEVVEACHDVGRSLGHWADGWRLVAGLDPAGANKDSGYTAMVLIGIDLGTGKRHIIDIVNHKQMPAPLIKETMLEWSSRYPIYEWRVEANGLQSQIIQYDRELVKELAMKGCRVVPHTTHKNKWDPQFGVESIAPLFHAELYSIPWGNAPTANAFRPLCDQLIGFPMAVLQDCVMAMWFAELGCRDLMKRSHLPMFDERKTRRWPARIKRRRRVVDFEKGEVRRVPVHEQRHVGQVTVGQRGYRRTMLGTPRPHSEVGTDPPPKSPPKYVNREGHVGDEN